MNTIIIVLTAMVFLAFLWVMTYRNILSHSFSKIPEVENAIREKFFMLFNKLPYFFEVMHEYKIQTVDMRKIRNDLINEKLKIENVFQNYLGLYTAIEEIFSVDDKALKSDVGFLEIKAELVDLHDEIRLLAKERDVHVKEFNGKIMRFPGNFVSNLFRYAPREELS